MKVPTYLLSHPILKMFKQNTLQMKMFEISIFLAFFTENLVKLHLKFVEQCPIDQNARSSCEVTLKNTCILWFYEPDNLFSDKELAGEWY